MARVLFSLLILVTTVACQPAPPTKEAATPTASFAPSQTSIPTSTATGTQIPEVMPTPTGSPAELHRRAGPVCENAFSALVENGPLTPPFAVMKTIAYEENSVWELSHQLPHLGSLSASEVRTLFCISETRTQAGTYTDGSPAYQLFWEVRAVSWPGGKVIGKNSFTGSSPHKNRVSGPGVAEALLPYPEFAAWVFNKVQHPGFLHFTEAVTTIAISPTNDLAAFGSAPAGEIVDRDYQAKIFLFRASSMQIISAVDGHQGMVTSLAFSPDGKTLASSGFDLFVKFWEVSTGHLLGQVNIADTPNSLAFSPDGRKLAVASKLDVAFVDAATMRIEKSLQEASGKDLVYSPEGARVYVNSLGSIKMIDPSANMVILSFPDPFALVPTMSVAADGSIVGVTYESPEAVDGFALSPDGSQIISYTIDHTLDKDSGVDNVRLAIWDAETGKYVNETKFSGNSIRAIRLSPDGKLLALGNDDQVWLWDTGSLQVRVKHTGHVGDVIDLAFTDDGTKLLSASNDGTIRSWSIKE